MKHKKFKVIEDHSVSKAVMDKRRVNEKVTILAMTQVYCRGHKHENREDYIGSGKLPAELQKIADRNARRFVSWRTLKLCPECFELVGVTEKRTSFCPHMAYKTYCHHCPRPCYTKALIDRIVPIMRYSGPRLMLTNPVLTYRHLKEVSRSRKLQKKAGGADSD